MKGRNVFFGRQGSKEVDNKAVSKPFAQSDTLLQVDRAEEATYNTLQFIAQAGINTFGIYSIGTDLMLSGGLRLSELLYPSMLFVNALGQVKINGTKGSAAKLVAPIYQRSYWLAHTGWIANPFSVVSRWSWYRFFKAQGVVMQEAGRGNNVVTHAARKLQAHSLFVAGVDIEQVSEIMGHKAVTSTAYYTPKRQEKQTHNNSNQTYGKADGSKGRKH